MAKTAKQIQSDIIALLDGSDLVKMLSGRVYRGTPESSYRPRDSRLEDLIVIFTEGTPEQIEYGTVTLNIYVPDVDPFNDGVLVEDGQRTEELESAADDWVKSLNCERSCYKFNLRQTIHTQYNPDIRQHFVVVKLGYQYFGDDDNDPILASEDESLVVITPKNQD